MSLSVIMPTYNEQATIKLALKRVLRQKFVQEVIVIDDGSLDNSVKIINDIKSKKIKLIKNKTTQGKGYCIRRGIKFVNSKYLIFQDADLEYNPKEYKKLLKYANSNTCVYGSRLLKDNPHAYERTYLGNIFLTQLFNFLFKTKLTDLYTCYKLIPSEIAKSLRLDSDGFEIEAEITAKIALRDIKILEMPIDYNPRSYEQGKKIRFFDGIKGLLVFVTTRLNHL